MYVTHRVSFLLPSPTSMGRFWLGGLCLCWWETIGGCAAVVSLHTHSLPPILLGKETQSQASVEQKSPAVAHQERLGLGLVAASQVPPVLQPSQAQKQ